VDKVELLAIDRAKALFGAEHANVQPHSGSQANFAVYTAVLPLGAKILGMNLSHGGHLTHGNPANFSGKQYQFVQYGVREDNALIDYDELAAVAAREKPAMITVGASAYSRIIDFARMGEIALSVGAYLFADIAHISGLVAAQARPVALDGDAEEPLERALRLVPLDLLRGELDALVAGVHHLVEHHPERRGERGAQRDEPGGDEVEPSKARHHGGAGPGR
jgi:hypothetical protein